MILVVLLPFYVVVAFIVSAYCHIEHFADGSDAARHGIFWPLYFVRWLVINFVLAIRGL